MKSYRHYKFILLNIQNIAMINGQEPVYSLLKGWLNHKKIILIALFPHPHLPLCTTETPEVRKQSSWNEKVDKVKN